MRSKRKEIVVLFADVAGVNLSPEAVTFLEHLGWDSIDYVMANVDQEDVVVFEIEVMKILRKGGLL